MKCPICGAENENSVAFCNFCGTALHDTTSGFMDGLDTSGLDLDQLGESGFGKKNTGASQPQPQTRQQYAQPQPQYSQPKQPQYNQPQYNQPQQPQYNQQQMYSQPQPRANDPYAANAFNAQQNFGQAAQNGFGARQPYQATGFQQNNAAFNDPANGFANPAYNGFGVGRAGGISGGIATRKKSYTGVLIAIVVLIVIIGVFGFLALKYGSKVSGERTVEMKCISVTLPGAMVKDESFDETQFVGRYDPSVMDVTTECYEDKDNAAFVYMKLSYPTLTSADLAGFDEDTFVNMYLAKLQTYSDYELIENNGNKAKCLARYDGKRVFMYMACRMENNAYYVSIFMCNENDRSTYESKFVKWDSTIKITN